MTIKKVVNKPKVTTVKEFPKFDYGKIYVTTELFSSIEGVQILSHDKGKFVWNDPTNTVTFFKDSFRDAILDRVVYILDNQEQLARFILGCREFPKVEEVEETVGQELAEDEVSVVDCINNKIYGMYVNNAFGSIYKAHTPLNNFKNYYEFISLSDCMSRYTTSKSLKELLLVHIDEDDTEIYQFDTQKEFLQWAYEQTTGKKITSIPEDKVLVDKAKIEEIIADTGNMYCPRHFGLTDYCEDNTCKDCAKQTVNNP